MLNIFSFKLFLFYSQRTVIAMYLYLIKSKSGVQTRLIVIGSYCLIAIGITPLVIDPGNIGHHEWS